MCPTVFKMRDSLLFIFYLFIGVMECKVVEREERFLIIF